MNLLKKLMELEKEASAFGFRWENTEQIMRQINSEYLEVNEHLLSKFEMNRLELQEEIGDLLHAVFSLCLFCHLDPEITLQKSLDKFEKRLKMVKLIAEEKGLVNVYNQPYDVRMAIWSQAKERT